MAFASTFKPLRVSEMTPEQYASRTIINRPTGEEITALAFSTETNGEYTLARVLCTPDGGPPEHFHLSYTERFTAIKGRLTLRHNGQWITLDPGESALVEIKDRHSFTNKNDSMLEFEVEVRPACPGLEKGLAIAFGLSNDGLCFTKGPMKNPIHLALFSKITDTKYAGPVGTIINPLVDALAMIGTFMGTEKYLVDKYAKWRTSTVNVKSI